MKIQKQSNVIGGIVLISMGIVMVLNNNGIAIMGVSPWLVWGLFLPVMAGLLMAYHRLQENGGHLDGRFLRQNLWVLFPLVIAAFVLFNLNWTYLSVIFFIGIGLSMMVGQTSKEA